MQIEEIISKTKEFLAEEFEVDQDKIVPEANLKDTLELDSLDYVDLVVVIESNFGIKIMAEDFIDVKTFQDFYNFIEKRLNQPK